MDLLSAVERWRFTPGETPLSAWYYPIGVSLLYFLTLYMCQRAMSNRKAYDLPAVLFLHNLHLSVLSLLLGAALLFLVLAQRAHGTSAFDMVCSRRMHEDGRLQMLYTVNYYVKYYELLDTFLLVLRKKPVSFLHSYHHAATLILTWSQLVEHSTVQWVPILLNLWVHVAMYLYYALAARKIRVSWKRYLTSAQILQFVLDVLVVGFAYGTYIRQGFAGCYGTDRGAIIGCVVLFSYLVLFIRFYLQTYPSPRKLMAKNAGHKNQKSKQQ